MDRIKKYLSQRREEGNLRELQPVEAREGGKIFRQKTRLIDFSSMIIWGFPTIHVSYGQQNRL